MRTAAKRGGRMMKNEYFNVTLALVFITLLCLLVSLASSTGLILVVAFGGSAIISVLLGIMEGD